MTEKNAIPKVTFMTRQDLATIFIKKIKLELGNKVTDWTPAPEDLVMESEIAAVTKGEIDDICI